MARDRGWLVPLGVAAVPCRTEVAEAFLWTLKIF